MTATVTQAEADAAAARENVDRTEADIATGNRRVTASALHKIRDAWRHADLTAEGARKRADQERRAARLAGLEQIGTAVEQLAASTETAAMTGALRDVATACARFRELAAGHDAAVAELVAAAQDHGVEPAAPGGPRGTSAHVAVEHGAIVYKRTRVRPLGSCSPALSKAMEGDVAGAIAELDITTHQAEPKRPDYLLRGENGMLIAITGELNGPMAGQISTGVVQRLGEREIDRWMAGELA